MSPSSEVDALLPDHQGSTVDKEWTDFAPCLLVA